MMTVPNNGVRATAGLCTLRELHTRGEIRQLTDNLRWRALLVPAVATATAEAAATTTRTESAAATGREATTAAGGAASATRCET